MAKITILESWGVIINTYKLADLLVEVDKADKNQIGGKVTDDEVAIFWLLARRLAKQGLCFCATLFPHELGRANNLDSPFTAISAKSNIIFLEFIVKRINYYEMKLVGTKFKQASKHNIKRKAVGIQFKFSNMDVVLPLKELGYEFVQVKHNGKYLEAWIYL